MSYHRRHDRDIYGRYEGEYRRPPRILFVSGFSSQLRAKDLAWEFERYGRLVRCDIPAMRSASSLPYAFIEFRDDRDAEDAYYEMHNRYIDDRRITVDYAKNPPTRHWRHEPGNADNTAEPSPKHREERERINGRSQDRNSGRSSERDRDRDQDQGRERERDRYENHYGSKDKESQHRRDRHRSSSPARNDHDHDGGREGGRKGRSSSSKGHGETRWREREAGEEEGVNDGNESGERVRLFQPSEE